MIVAPAEQDFSDGNFELGENDKCTQTPQWVRRLRRARDLQDSFQIETSF